VRLPQYIFVAETTASRHPHLSVVQTFKEQRRAKLTSIRPQQRSEIMKHYISFRQAPQQNFFRLTARLTPPENPGTARKVRILHTPKKTSTPF